MCTSVVETYGPYPSGITPLSAEEMGTVVQNTIKHSESEAWLGERKGRRPALQFRRLITSRKPEIAVKAAVHPSAQFRCAAVRHGRQHEGYAVHTYCKLMPLYDRGIAAEKTGLHVHYQHPFLAAFPDRIIREGSDVELLEVKSLYSCIGSTPKEPCSNKKYFCTIRNHKVTLKREHAYYMQVQGQMAVTDQRHYKVYFTFYFL